MEWRGGRSSLARDGSRMTSRVVSRAGSRGTSRIGSFSSREARLSRSESQPRPGSAGAAVTAGGSAGARRGGGAKPPLSLRCGGRGGGISLRGISAGVARGSSLRPPTTASVGSSRVRRSTGSTASRLRPWRATMRLSSARASIWSTMTRRIWAALSAVSCGSSKTPRRSSLRVLSSSRCISAAICFMPWTDSAKRSFALWNRAWVSPALCS